MSLKSSFLLSVFSAVLLILSFPAVDIGFFAWFGLVPLLFAIEGKKPKQAFFLSYLTGIIFFSAILYWLVNVSFPGLIGLVLYLGLYFGAFGLLVSKVSKWNTLSQTYFVPFGLARLLFIPSLWVSLEFLRSYLFTGFGWALLGYSQYLNLPLIQISDITGVYGVSFLIVVINVAIYSVVRCPRTVIREKKKYLIPVLLLTLTLVYGYYKLSQTPKPDLSSKEGEQKPIKISVIQGNILQDIKWDEDSQNFIVDRYDHLTRTAAFNRPELIIWPETAVPVYPTEEELLWDKVLNLTRDMKIPLLTGLPRNEAGKTFNSAALISGEGEVTAYYDKIRLVPFGEYTPDVFSFVEMIDERAGGGGFTPGNEYTIFEIPLSDGAVKFAVLICFETTFPHLARGNVKRGADFLVNLTNDAWFGPTSEPYQHAQILIFRAIENRVNIVRSANTGPTMFIDPRGKIFSLLANNKGEDLFITGHKTAKIHLSKRGLSFYTRFGDIFAFLSIVTAISFLFRFRSTPP